jgi:hypothetical protein
VVLTAPANVTEAACQTQAQIDTKYTAWLAQATATGGCSVTVTNNSTAAPSACGGVATVTFTATSASCSTPETKTATFTVTAAPAVVLTAPANVTEAACQTQAQIDTKYTAWLAQATATGGCSVTVTNNSTAAPSACGGVAQ